MLGVHVDELDAGLVSLIETVERCVAKVARMEVDIELDADALAVLVTFYQLRFDALIQDLLERVSELERDVEKLERKG
jgi:hypothetical protein